MRYADTAESTCLIDVLPCLARHAPLPTLCDCKESQIARDKELLDEIRAKKNMAETVARLYESSGIKRKYMGCTLDNYDTEGDPRKVKALLTAQRYVETFGDRES